MFDGLKGPNRLAELVAVNAVLHGHVKDRQRDAEFHGRHEQLRPRFEKPIVNLGDDWSEYGSRQSDRGIDTVDSFQAFDFVQLAGITNEAHGQSSQFSVEDELVHDKASAAPTFNEIVRHVGSTCEGGDPSRNHR